MFETFIYSYLSFKNTSLTKLITFTKFMASPTNLDRVKYDVGFTMVRVKYDIEFTMLLVTRHWNSHNNVTSFFKIID